MMTTIIVFIMFMAITFLVLAATYVFAAILFSKSGVNMFYVALPVNRMAFVQKGGKVVRMIYNSNNVKLIADFDTTVYPLGKFVPISDPRESLQKQGPVEKMLGIYYIGIPFVHSLMGKSLNWISVEGVKFNEHTNEVKYEFAITKTFGFDLKGLTLGRDSDNGKDKGKGKKQADDQKMQRILVNLKFMLQCFIENPYRALIETNWMASVEAKLSALEQKVLGTTSQDELIARKIKDGDTYCELVQILINNKSEIETFGVTFEDKKITYIDYELAGGTETVQKIQAANTKRFEKEQEAAGIRAIKSAEQEDLLTQKKIMIETIRDLMAKNKDMTIDQAERIALSMMRTKALTETKVTTLVEGGANVTTAITAGNSGKGK